MSRLILVFLVLVFSGFNPSFGHHMASVETVSGVSSVTNQAPGHENFSIEITRVGISGFDNGSLTPVKDNIYEIYDDSDFVLINLQFNVSGLTSWNLGNVTFPEPGGIVDFGNATATIGQIFVQVEDFVVPVTTLGFSGWGFGITLPRGDNVVTAIYVGYDEQSKIVFSTDTIVVRIRETSVTLSEYKTYSFPLNGSLIDEFEAGSFEKSFVSTHLRGFGRLDYFLNRDIQPTAKIDSLTIGELDLTNNRTLVLNENSINQTIKLIGNVNTTGFTDLQILNNFTKAQGIAFISHSGGLTPFSQLSEITISEGQNYFGIFVLAPFGLWHVDIPCVTNCTDVLKFTDWEDQFNRIIPQSNSSFDFVYGLSGFNFIFAIENVITTTEQPSINPYLLGGSISFFAVLIVVVAVFRIRRKVS